MLNTDYKFQISVYLRLAEMLPAKDRAKREYYENKIEELLERQTMQDNTKYIPDDMKNECYLACEKILSEYANYPKKEMTLTNIINNFPELKKFDNAEIGKSLTSLGLPAKIKKQNGTTVRIRLFPIVEKED